MFQAIMLCIQCLCLGESASLGVLSVTRTSLDGFAVAGPVGVAPGLDAWQAAMLLAGSAALATGTDVVQAHPADLLRVAAREGVTFETWYEGPAARRRYEALMRRFGSGNVSKATTKATGFGDDKRNKVTIRFTARGPVPAYEVAS